MSNNRRTFLKKTALASAGIAGLSLNQSCTGWSDRAAAGPTGVQPKNRIGVSTYSFWQFNGPKEDFPIEQCIDDAARMGFDGIELLLVQMASEENAYLQQLKRRAFHAGLDLMGFSTHQGFVSPEKEYRRKRTSYAYHTLCLQRWKARFLPYPQYPFLSNLIRVRKNTHPK